MIPGKLVLLNLRRHRLRTFIGAAGICLGVAAMMTVLSIVMGAVGMFERILSNNSEFLVFERNVSDLFFSSVSDEATATIRALPMVENANPLLFGIVSSPGHPVITCFGLNADDPRIQHAEWIGGNMTAFHDDSALIYIGVRAAEFLNAKTGDTIPIGKGEFTIGGVFKTENGFEDGGVFMPLKLAQTFFNRQNQCSLIAIKLKDRSEGNAFRADIQRLFPELIGLENEEFSQSYSQFKILNATATAIGLCTFLLGGLGVANTLLLSVFSRIRELAILQVCGFSRAQIVGLILGEALILALLGSTLGTLVGVGALHLLEAIPHLHGYIQGNTEPWILVSVWAAAFVTSLCGALYPTWYAAHIEPAQALRYE
jgi:putative ABC transport system permease protein